MILLGNTGKAEVSFAATFKKNLYIIFKLYLQSRSGAGDFEAPGVTMCRLNSVKTGRRLKTRRRSQDTDILLEAHR